MPQNSCTLFVGGAEFELPLKPDMCTCVVRVAGNLVFKLKLFNCFGGANTRHTAHMQFLKSLTYDHSNNHDLVRIAAYCPGHLVFMEGCKTDMWHLLTGPPQISDALLIAYLTFGARVLGALSADGIEARNYKAKNVALTDARRMCILDTQQLLPVARATSAVCTFPATRHYTYGSTSYTGIAATAWAFIADAGSLLGFGADRLSYKQVNLVSSAQAADEYQNPIQFANLYAYLHQANIFETVKCSRHVLINCMVAYRTFFPNGHVPASVHQAAKHGAEFFSGVLRIIHESKLMHGVQ